MFGYIFIERSSGLGMNIRGIQPQKVKKVTFFYGIQENSQDIIENYSFNIFQYFALKVPRGTNICCILYLLEVI